MENWNLILSCGGTMEGTSGLQLIMCPGSLPDRSYETYYNKIYDCWSTVWSNALSEIGARKKLLSDTFSRQDYAASIFLNGECLALILLRWFDSGLRSFQDDSFFSFWPAEDIERVRSMGSRILLVSGMAASPSARQNRLGLKMRDVLGGVVVEAFRDSDAHGIASSVRVDRKVSDAFARWGGFTIRERVPFEFDVNNTNLMAFSRDSVSKQSSKSPHELETLVKSLWRGRINIPREHIQFPVPKSKWPAA